jgi:murein tripeptide amidase MpaA
MTYLNVDEVESALIGLETTYPTLCQRITLPHDTFEGRTCHAIRIGRGSSVGSRDGILFLGSVHACEWGGADICISFAADLVEAAATGAGLTYGGKSFPASAIKTIATSLDVFVFPCVNPDGRQYSQAGNPLWRKNRNPAMSGGDPTRVGVDVNRNFDVLWDFATKMDPKVPGASSVTSEPNYHGPSAESEAETKNVVWLLDAHPNIRWLMDIHCHAGDVLCSWSDDQNQTTDPSQNFLNPFWDGKRGRAGDTYAEYIPPADLLDEMDAAGRFGAALSAVRGTVYNVIQSWVLYPTTGTSDDYAYSRHFTNPAKSKVTAYTVEYGLKSRPEENTFQPAPPIMWEIIREVTAGMVELCLTASALRLPQLPVFVRFRHLWPWEILGPLSRRTWRAAVLVAVGILALVVRAVRGRRQ